MTFAAPHGLPLIPGSYEGATSLFPAPAAGTPGLDVEGDGSACSTVTCRFEIQNVAFGYGTRVDALDATFEQHCDGAVPALRGSIQTETESPMQPICVRRLHRGPQSTTAAARSASSAKASTWPIARASGCSSADWRGDSPLRPPRDCRVEGGICVAR